MAFLLSFSPHSNPNPRYKSLPRFKPTIVCNSTKRELVLKTTAISLTLALSFSQASLASPPANVASKSILSSISSTKSWFQYFGSGFAIRIPPGFDDVEGPEDYSAGMSMYGDKAKPKTYAARFSSPDGSEVVSVVIRPSNQIKITFLEAKDIADFGSLKQVAKLFVPGGSKVYSARIIKIKETDGIRNYYFYEFGIADQHVALVAAANSGKVYVSGAAAPESKWDEDGVMLRSAAISLSILLMLSELQKMDTGALPRANTILEELLNAYFSCESKDLVTWKKLAGDLTTGGETINSTGSRDSSIEFC